MYLCYCDLCNSLIKEGDNKSIFAINSVTHKDVQEEKTMETLEDLQEAMLYQKKNIKSYEICKKCKRVLEHFTNLRSSKVKAINKILEKLDDEKLIKFKLSEEDKGNV